MAAQLAEAPLGVFAGGTTLDIYADPGRYARLIEGVAGGAKGKMDAIALRLADIAVLASHPDMLELGVPDALGIKTHAGGGAGNGAAGVGYLGGEATLVTVLGNGDPVSNLIRQDLRRVPGLTLAEVQAGCERPPRRSFNLRPAEGGNRVWLTEEERPISGEVLDAFNQQVHRSSRGAGFLALSSLAPDQVRPVLEVAQAPVAINPSSAWYKNGQSDELMPELKELLYGSGLFAVELNESEITALHGGQAPTVENATKLAKEMSRHVGYVVCTFGRDGAILVAHNEDAELGSSFDVAGCDEPPVPDEYFVDNGGAGDAFFAGVLHGIATGVDLKTAIGQGRLLAGLACMDRSAHGYVHGDPVAERSKLGL